jgi:hypothetical protein
MKPIYNSMNLAQRLQLLSTLREYMLSGNAEWPGAREMAHYWNPWFLPEFIDLSVTNLATHILDGKVLNEVAERYRIPDQPSRMRTVGLVMAGNLPLVGFHDMVCIFLSGHRQLIRPSSKDEVLIRHLAGKMAEWDSRAGDQVSFRENLKGCDAYIATGSNHSARYFEQYFASYPHIIRRNRTSVAILDGSETEEELALLADDIQLYFGLGCRNVTQVWVPEAYNFEPLLDALKSYDHLMDLHKYKHNYDYVLTVNLMNRQPYMTNGSIVLSPGTSPYSGIANLNYAYYTDPGEPVRSLDPDTLQVITGHGYTPFGKAQCPSFTDYADRVDTMAFLGNL